jgi:hypothetical protein
VALLIVVNLFPIATLTVRKTISSIVVVMPVFMPRVAILPFVLALILDSELIVAFPQIPRFIPDLPGVK